MDDQSASPAVRRIGAAEDPAAACMGKSCQSCTAGVIADCVAVCCCPCGVVNILALAFLKLPWAVARRCVAGRRRRRRIRREEEEDPARKRELEISSIGSDDFRGEDGWLDQVHLGFGRVSSFTGLDKGN